MGNPDGSVYTGQWKDGFPDGHGEWKRGKKHGFGIMRFSNGDVYQGDWTNGQFQNRGKYTYSSGDEFLGMWQDGVKQSGSFYFTGGRISRRVWERGMLVSCQEFDARKRTYHPTHKTDRVHDPASSSYGSKDTTFNLVGPTGPLSLPRELPRELPAVR